MRLSRRSLKDTSRGYQESAAVPKGKNVEVGYLVMFSACGEEKTKCGKREGKKEGGGRRGLGKFSPRAGKNGKALKARKEGRCNQYPAVCFNGLSEYPEDF